jgi:hypothetical protein
MKQYYRWVSTDGEIGLSIFRRSPEKWAQMVVTDDVTCLEWHGYCVAVLALVVE